MSQTPYKKIVPEADDEDDAELTRLCAEADRQDGLLLNAGVDPWHLVAPCGTYEILPGDPDYKAARAERESLIKRLVAKADDEELARIEAGLIGPGPLAEGVGS
jgi:hypothetical protein